MVKTLTQLNANKTERNTAGKLLIMKTLKV